MAMLVGVVLGMLITVVRAPFFRVSVLLHPSAKGARGRGAAKELCCASLLFVSEKRWTDSWVFAPELPRGCAACRAGTWYTISNLQRGYSFLLCGENRLRVAAVVMSSVLPPCLFVKRVGGGVVRLVDFRV